MVHPLPPARNRVAGTARWVGGALLLSGGTAIVCPPTLAAQDSTVVAPYVITLPTSVRSIGMSGAAVALVGDAGAVFSNPSGLATISHISLEGAYRRAPGSAYLLSGALGWRIRQFDLGIGGRYFDLGDDPTQYVGAGAPPGSNSREVLGVGSLVYRYGLIALGVSGRYTRRSVDSVHVRGFSGDIGLTIAFFDIMALAASVQNIGGNWRSASALPMPRVTRAGFTMNYVDPQETFRLLSTVEVQWPEGRGARGVFGVEGGIVVEGVGILARAGYGGEAPGLPNSKFSLGGSVTIGVLDLDYAYRSSDLFEERAHHFGLRLTL